MAKCRSFTDYVTRRFYNQFYAAIEHYITENEKSLRMDLKRVRKVGEVSLCDLDVKYTSVNDFPDMQIQFNVIIEAEIEVAEGDYHYDDSDICHHWFQLGCYGDLACNLDDFQINNVSTYTQKNKMVKPLSDSLVPYIRKEDLEDIATDFLQRNYPKALLTPVAIDPKELAENMGLTVNLQEITKDFSIFGQIYFHECDTEFYDEKKDAMVRCHVEGGTVIVDPKAYFLRNLGSVNNTIIHECVHWDKHRKAFELERLYNSALSKIKCEVVGGIKDSNIESTSWMEWQANALAPRIQMPLGMFKKQASEFIRQYRTEMGVFDLIDVMEPVIDALSVHFCVSRAAAKIRMIDAGYEEAIGAFIYIDGRYVRPHKFKAGILEENQTFSIGVADAAILSLTNPELCKSIRDGSYVYVDSHFVVNHPKFLTRDTSGQTILTEYARKHMEECCLIFDLSIKSGSKGSYHSECFLNRDEHSTVGFEIKYGNGYENSTPEKQKQILAETLKEEIRIYGELPTNYLSALKIVKKWRNVTFKELGERTMVHERTIRRIINGEEPGSLNSIILICLGLHLPSRISKHIIDSSPFSLNFNNESHLWYDFVLTHMYGHTLEEIRGFLADNGAVAL